MTVRIEISGYATRDMRHSLKGTTNTTWLLRMVGDRAVSVIGISFGSSDKQEGR